MNKEKETRTLSIELRSAEDRTIEGRAIVFNSLSQDMGFREQILPEAITEDVLNNSDIFMLYNHNPDRGYLARANKGKGSLKIDIREDGVYFSFIAPHTALAEEVREHMLAGDLNKCSFAFTVASDTWEKNGNDYLRTINKIDRLYDLSLVDSPAYMATSCKCARFDEILAEEKAEAEKKMAELREQEEAKLAEYYKSLKEEYKEYLKS